MRHAAPLLIGRDDQRRQSRRTAGRLQVGQFRRDLGETPAAHVAARQVDPADQPFRGQLACFVDVGITGNDVGADGSRGRSSVQHHGAGGLKFQFALQCYQKYHQKQHAHRPAQISTQQPGETRYSEQGRCFDVTRSEQQGVLEVPGG